MRKSKTLGATAVAAFILTLVPAAHAQDDWHFGIGTGLFGLNISGDAGFTTIAGPITFDSSLDSDEVREYVESGFGGGGFAAKGKWVIEYSGGQLELRDTLKGKTPAGTRAEAEVRDTKSGAEVSAKYRFALTGRHTWSVLGGARYTKHEYDFDLEVGTQSFKRDIDQDWTDVLVGLTHGFRISERWSWGNRFDVGFGASEGTYFFKTGLNWQVARHFALGFSGQWISIDFENDEEGDPDWYFYDAEEFGVGFSALITW